MPLGQAETPRTAQARAVMGIDPSSWTGRAPCSRARSAARASGDSEVQ